MDMKCPCLYNELCLHALNKMKRNLIMQTMKYSQFCLAIYSLHAITIKSPCTPSLIANQTWKLRSKSKYFNVYQYMTRYPLKDVNVFIWVFVISSTSLIFLSPLVHGLKWRVFIRCKQTPQEYSLIYSAY